MALPRSAPPLTGALLLACCGPERDDNPDLPECKDCAQGGSGEF